MLNFWHKLSFLTFFSNRGNQYLTLIRIRLFGLNIFCFEMPIKQCNKQITTILKARHFPSGTLRTSFVPYKVILIFIWDRISEQIEFLRWYRMVQFCIFFHYNYQHLQNCLRKLELKVHQILPCNFIIGSSLRRHEHVSPPKANVGHDIASAHDVIHVLM